VGDPAGIAQAANMPKVANRPQPLMFIAVSSSIPIRRPSAAKLNHNEAPGGK
jgi:hypothetical protein